MADVSPRHKTKHRQTLVGCVLAGLLAGLIGTAILMMVNLDRTGDAAANEAAEMSRYLAQRVSDELKELSRDGELTDQEIVDTLFWRQSELRSHDRNRERTQFVIAAYGSASGPFGSVDGTRCFEFTITEPITTNSVSFTELHTCPPVVDMTINATKPSRS